MTSNIYTFEENGSKQMLVEFRFYDYNLQPARPEGWQPVVSRYLAETQIHEVHGWLWDMCAARWSSVTHYTPELRLCVWFQKLSDAVAFKLAWGGA